MASSNRDRRLAAGPARFIAVTVWVGSCATIIAKPRSTALFVAALQHCPWRSVCRLRGAFADPYC
jgi:hypothetical protein